MTEEQAKTKWCPFMDPDKPLIVPAAYRRAVQAAIGAAPATCIGSACMAWSWNYEEDGTRSKMEGHCGLLASP